MAEMQDRTACEEVIIAGCVIRMRFTQEPDPMTMQNMKRILFDSGCIVSKSEEICGNTYNMI